MKDAEDGGNGAWEELEQCCCPLQNERISQVVKERRAGRVPFLERRLVGNEVQDNTTAKSLY